MKTLSNSTGPFAERPHYEIEEIERICSDALKSTGLLPDMPQPVRIDRFVEKYFELAPRYEDLPNGVLGYTEFGESGVKAIVVTRTLDQEGGNVSERRIRTTLAHESGHGLLHMHLFALGGKPTELFGGETSRPEILCRDVEGENTGRGRYDGRWWEYQANRAIGGLLLPRRLFLEAAEAYSEEHGEFGLPTIPSARRELAVRELAEVFDVNPVVARIRLDELFPSSTFGQLTL